MSPAIIDSILAGFFMLSKNKKRWLKEGRGQGELADYIVKISQKRYRAAGINFLQPLSA